MSKTGSVAKVQASTRKIVERKMNAKKKGGSLTQVMKEEAIRLIARPNKTTQPSVKAGKGLKTVGKKTKGVKPGALSHQSEADVSAKTVGPATTAKESAGKIHKDGAEQQITIGVQRTVFRKIAHPDLTLVMDTETTGLPNNLSSDLKLQPSIIEFAGRVFEGRKEVDRIEFLINPGFPLPKEKPNIPKITGITDEMLAPQPKFMTYLPTLKELFFGVRRVVGHNPFFDIQLIFFELQRLGLENAFPWPMDVIDTVEMSMDIKGFRLSLQDLHQNLFGEGFSAHRAMPDVIACARSYFHLLDRDAKK